MSLWEGNMTFYIKEEQLSGLGVLVTWINFYLVYVDKLQLTKTAHTEQKAHIQVLNLKAVFYTMHNQTQRQATKHKDRKILLARQVRDGLTVSEQQWTYFQLTL